MQEELQFGQFPHNHQYCTHLCQGSRSFWTALSRSKIFLDSFHIYISHFTFIYNHQYYTHLCQGPRSFWTALSRSKIFLDSFHITIDTIRTTHGSVKVQGLFCSRPWMKGATYQCGEADDWKLRGRKWKSHSWKSAEDEDFIGCLIWGVSTARSGAHFPLNCIVPRQPDVLTSI